MARETRLRRTGLGPILTIQGCIILSGILP